MVSKGRMIFAVVCLALAVALAAARWYIHRPAPPAQTASAFHGGTFDPVVQAPQIVMTDHRGREFDLHAETAAGNVIVLFFGYTSCPDVCPTTLAHHKQVKQILGEKGSQVRFVMVSVDPERDTRERMGQYVEAFDQDFIGLTGTRDELAAVWEAYNVVPEKQEMENSALGYAVSHPAFTYVIDRSGNLRLVHFLGIPADAVAEDLTRLLQERA